MTDRVSRSRDQIDQLRSELMQERSSKQDLELDKNAMERHVCDVWELQLYSVICNIAMTIRRS